jgi:amino acid transporter
VSIGGAIASMSSSQPTLPRHFGLLHATALNISMIVGAGVFITIPLMLKELPGPAALLAWVAAGVLMVADGLVWSELAAMMPGSGGSYRYLLEAFGPKRWGRLMAFLFVWQFLISGPLEIASALIAMATFSNGLHPAFKTWNQRWTWDLKWLDVGITLSPARLLALCVGIMIVALLYRRATTLGRLTVAVTVGVIAIIGWILVDGLLHFHLDKLTALPVENEATGWLGGLGKATILAMYAYLGYYNICYVGDEVREPGKTIPKAILLSALTVSVLFVGVHLAMLGTVSWTDIPTSKEGLDDYNLPAEFARQLHGPWAAGLMSLLLMGSCFASAFAGLLGYSRIPYGAARYGHFFRSFAAVHPTLRIPHVSLLAVGALTLMWTFFDLEAVIAALLTLRILEQFVLQIVGVMLLRATQPDRPRPYRIWLYPLPCLIALAGWLYLYASSDWLFICIGAVTLTAGVVAFLVWSAWARTWPFASAT